MSKAVKTAFVFWLAMSLLLMVVFPAHTGRGSFQAVNGPTTVFQAWRAAMLFMLLLISYARLLTARTSSETSLILLPDRASRFAPMLC